MTYFIGYDISDSEQRCRTASLLENYGVRIQYSFFQCELDPKTMEEVFSKLKRFIDPEYDSLHVYPVCKDCLNLKIVLGKNRICEEHKYLII